LAIGRFVTAINGAALASAPSYAILAGMNVMTLEPPRETANPAPVQPLGSIRRTSSIDVSWPGEPMGDRVMHGRARDFVLPAGGGAGHVRADAWMEALLKPDKTIAAIKAEPAPANLQRLVGERGGGHLRLFLRDTMPELIEGGDPLYLLLDDISGVSLVCGWGWSLWRPDWMEQMRQSMGGDVQRMMEERAGVCWGLQRGHSGMDPDRASFTRDAADGGELRNPSDPGGWHEFPAIEGVSMRRARRIDVRREAASGLVHIDSAFQDSAPKPDGGRAALHEYRLRAVAAPDTLELLSLEPEARVLPFYECPGAITNARGLVGTTLGEIRDTVLNELRGPKGCTHLNDTLRALADVPKLVEALPSI
jgi:hypothetical protein